MTSDSRILTVSYGTFSCTLEGFDDPFNTMKAIAEYFRDLTAEDRYFGSEPVQPDPAMLHRVADREVSRLVGSKARDAGLVLRPGDLAVAEGRVTGRPRTARAPVDEPAPAPEPQIVEPALQDAMPTGVVAKLARIREAVSQPLDETRAAPLLPEDILNAFREEIEDQAPDAVPTQDSPVAETEAADLTEATSADAASRIGALLQDPDADPATGDNIFADLSVSDTSGEHAIDAASGDEAPFIAADDLEAEAFESEAPSPLMPVQEMFAPIIRGHELLSDATLPEDMPSVGFRAEVTLADEMLDEMLDEDGLSIGETAVVSHADYDAAALETLTAATEAEAVLEATTETLAETWADAATSEPEAPPADFSAGSDADMPVEVTYSEDDVEAPLPLTRTGKTRRVSSRVVRIHAEDDGSERPAGNATRMVSLDEAEDLARLMRQADDVMADEENRRRIESLAHLKAAVLATEADRAAGEAMRFADAADTEAYRDDLSQVVQPDSDPATSEVRPRRKTVSVRPQEPRPGTIRPGMISPPPLVLVSEQRVDRIVPAPEAPPVVAPAARAPAPLPAGPSQPGIEGQPMVALRTGRLTGAIGIGAAASPVLQTERVVLNRAAPAPAAEMDDEDGFDEHLSPTVESGLASFAERVGVKSMAEMLEAAAAYATCVERREQFTRPQLMRRLMASAGGKPVSREDGLRSFGTLLRTGRIEKVGRGHYVLAEQSPYLAEARRFN
jgi:hypothetical protein